MRYVVGKLMGAVCTMAVLVIVSFALMHAVPGGPFDTEQPLLPEVRARLEHQYHLDQPWIVQLGYYLWHVIQGDLGPSFRYPDRSVQDLIAQGWKVSAILGFSAMGLASLLGIGCGLWAGYRPHSMLDMLCRGWGVLGICLPAVVVGPLLVGICAIYGGWLPAGGWGNGHWRHLVLPVITLALPHAARMAYLMRASVIEVLQSPFILAARARGLSEIRIAVYQVLRLAVIPVVSYMGPAVAGVITGSVVVEQVFGLPGLGLYFVQGTLNRDYTLVMGLVICFGITLVLCNALVDLAYAALDPRIRQGRDPQPGPIGGSPV